MTLVWTVRRGPSVPALMVMVSLRSNLFYSSVLQSRAGDKDTHLLVWPGGLDMVGETGLWVVSDVDESE
jgi:hypothetical protein